MSGKVLLIDKDLPKIRDFLRGIKGDIPVIIGDPCPPLMLLNGYWLMGDSLETAVFSSV